MNIKNFATKVQFYQLGFSMKNLNSTSPLAFYDKISARKSTSIRYNGTTVELGNKELFGRPKIVS